jgi:hypothetical protein
VLVRFIHMIMLIRFIQTVMFNLVDLYGYFNYVCMQVSFICMDIIIMFIWIEI